MPWVSYADHFEDVVLRRFFRELSTGSYVDIGPLDPIRDSVTKHFYDHGWRGINILSDPDVYAAFRAARPNDLHLLAAIGEGGEGGASDPGFLLKGGADSSQGLLAFPAEHLPERIDFLRAGGAGWEAPLLGAFPFSRVRPPVVLLRESAAPTDPGSRKSGAEPLLASWGYALAYADGRSRFYLAPGQSEKRGRLAIPPNLSDDFIPSAHAEELEALRRQSAELVRLTGILSLANRRLEQKREASPLRRIERGLRSALRGRATPKESAPPPEGTDLQVPKGVPSAGPLEVLRFSGHRPFGAGIGELPRLLLLQLDHIGDFVKRLPAVGLLRSVWPGAEIDLICGPWNLPFARRCGYFRKIVPFAFFPERSGHWSSTPGKLQRVLSDFARLARELGEYDLAVDLRTDPDTRCLLEPVRARLRAGYAAADSGVFLDISLPNPEHPSPGERNRRGLNRELSALLLIRAVEATLLATGAPTPHPLLAAKPEGGEGAERLVAVAPGSGSSARRWATGRFASVCRILANDHRCSILLLGSASERADADRIAREIPPSRCRDLVGKIALADLPEHLAGARVFLGNDSGVSHLAASLGVPTVVVHSGAADVHLAHPVGKKVSVLRLPLPCAPCWLARAEDCPHAMACLEGISPEAAIREVLFWLGEAVGASSGG